MSAFMDSGRNMQDESTAYIWLRHATQYVRDEQTYSFEVSVPVPVGATPEVKDRLFREAQEDMQQFVTQLDQRRPLASLGNHTSQSVSITAPHPSPRTKPTPNSQAVSPRTNTTGHPLPSNRPASQSAPPTAALDSDRTRSEQHTGRIVHERTEHSHFVEGGNTSASSENGGMPLPQFIQYIKENFNLSPRQAMDILGVRSLTNGINLRDALEQLENRFGQDGPAPTTTTQDRGHDVAREEQRENTGASNSPAPEGRTPTGSLRKSDGTSSPIELPGSHSAPAFDEEIGPEEDRPEDLDGLGDLDDLPPFDDDLAGDQFSAQELAQARAKLEALRAIQGATVVNDSRLRVLHNVLDGQIDETQLATLIQGVWNIAEPKRLKVDQVEELISWAKREDNFLQQVEAVLAVLGE